MNKNIIERLKGEAQETCGEGLGGYYYRLDENKFAKLIIKECIKVAEDTVDDGDSAHDTNMANYICRNIQHHFGVENCAD